jgi:hypothetical protein
MVQSPLVFPGYCQKIVHTLVGAYSLTSVLHLMLLAVLSVGFQIHLMLVS